MIDDQAITSSTAAATPPCDEAVRQEFARVRRIGLSSESCFDRAVRVWLNGHPDADRMTAERAVAAILDEPLRTGTPAVPSTAAAPDAAASIVILPK